MRVRVAGVKGLFHGLTFHDFDRLSKLNLPLIENERVGEDLGDAFQLVVGCDDEMSALGEIYERVGKVAATFDIESVERFIEKKDVGLLGQGPGDESPLLLAA
jgi:hypothetical protein